MANSKIEATANSRAIVNTTTARNSLMAWLPCSTIALTYAEALMVRNIAREFQVEIPEQDTASVVGAVSGAVTGHTIAELFKGAGAFFVHPLIAAGIAKTIGEAAITHFHQISPLP